MTTTASDKRTSPHASERSRWIAELERSGWCDLGLADTGRSDRDEKLRFYTERLHPDDVSLLEGAIAAALDIGEGRFLCRALLPDRSLRWHEGRVRLTRIDDGNGSGLSCAVIDVTERERAASFAVGQSLIFEQIAAGVPLRDVLESLIVLVEEQMPGSLGSVLLLDEGGTRLLDGAAPSLPAEYRAAVDGIEIGLRAGSCGTAVYRRKQVVVSEIAADPLWADHRELALEHGLSSCWSTPILDAAGEPLGAFAVYRREPGRPTDADLAVIESITHIARVAIERGCADRRLAEAEAKFRTLVEQLPLVTYVAALDDPEAPAVYISPQAEAMLGYAPEEWTADPHFWSTRLLHPDDRARVLAEHRETRLRGKPLSAEYRLLARDGRAVHVIDKAVVVTAADGRPSHFQGYLLDVTVEREAVAALRDSLLVLEHANEMIWICETDGRVRLASPSSTHVLGYEPDELQGVEFASLVHPEDLAAAQLHIASALQGERPAPTPARLRHRSGDWITLEGVASPVVGADGRLEAFVATARDVRELRQLEVQLASAQRLEAVGQLAGGIAHDFNNLLTAISGYSTLALDRLNGDNPALRDEIEQIQIASSRAATLTQQLLAFSRQQPAKRQAVSLNESVDEVVGLLERVLGADVAIKTRFGQPLGLIEADSSQISQVLMNLLVNARDAMPDGGQIEISTRNVDFDTKTRSRPSDLEPGSYVQLTVSDTGTGIEEALLTHIFEPFFTTKDVGKGTGLGLATIHGIVKQSGGAIQVDSSPGRGSRFTLLFPRRDDLDKDDLLLDKKTRHVSSAAEPRGGRILLVEDEELVRRVTRAMLERGGYEVLEAPSPEQALAWCKSGEPWDLVLTDLTMPGMSGHELARRLRQLRQDTRVLYMSGRPDKADDSTEPLDAPLLHKPFSPEQLRASVQAVLNARD